MSGSKIIETLNGNIAAFCLLIGNLLLLWIPIYTFIPNPKIAYYGLIYLLFILAANSSETIEKLFVFPGSVGMPLYFKSTRFILSLSSLTFFLLWIFKNLQAAYLYYSVLIFIVILIYFFEIIMYPKVLRNKTHEHQKNDQQWSKQKANDKLREQQRWDNLSLEGQCDEICRNIKNCIDSNYLNNANSLLDNWREVIIDLKGSNYFNNLINLYNNRAKQNRKEDSKAYNWQCSKCHTIVKQHYEPSGKCYNSINHSWDRL